LPGKSDGCLRVSALTKNRLERATYESIVCDPDWGIVEYVVDDREQKILESYYRQFTVEDLAQIEGIAMDMWDPYIAATRACVADADKKIVFDRFHATHM
jgi:transposase